MHPVLLRAGPLTIYSYGLLIAVGGVVSALFWRSRGARIGFRSPDDLWLLLNLILLGGFLGGRVLFLFEYTAPFSPDFWRAAVGFNNGFSVMGAFFGVIGGVWWFARRVKTGFLRALDYVCQAAPLWHFFGRLGCFMAGCCYGRPTSVPWAVVFRDPSSQIAPELFGVPVHPTQLYEAAGNLLIAAGLYRFVLLKTEAGALRPGTLSAAYLLSYGALRFVEEFYRGDAVPLPLGLTAAQAFCLALGAAALAGLAVVYRKGPRTRPCIPS